MFDWEAAQAACATLGLVPLRVVASAPDRIDAALAQAQRERAQAIVVVADGMYLTERDRLAALIGAARLPSAYGLREHVIAGGLLSYAADIAQNYRDAAVYVDKILRGARPADLPVAQPTRYQLVLNLKTPGTLNRRCYSRVMLAILLAIPTVIATVTDPVIVDYAVSQARPATEDEIAELLGDSLQAFPRDAAPIARDALRAEWTQRFGREGHLMHYESPGCDHCARTGQKGRAGIHELMVVTRELRQQSQTGERAEVLQRTALADGMKTLRQDGIEKVLQGWTSIEEVRATSNV